MTPHQHQHQQSFAGPSTSNHTHSIAAQFASPRIASPGISNGPPDRILSSGKSVGQGVKDFFSWTNAHNNRDIPHHHQQLTPSPPPHLYEEPVRRGANANANRNKGKGKGKAKQTTTRLQAPNTSSSASLEPTGWNQAFPTESDPLLRPPQQQQSKSKRPYLTKQSQRSRPDHEYQDLLASTSTSTNSNSRLSVFAGIGTTRRKKKRRWYMDLFRPKREKVEEVLDQWTTRHGILCLLPSLIVWFWCAVPFPKSHPNSPGNPWCDDTPDAPWCRPSTPEHRQSQQAHETDANFWFFLLFYYGLYAAVALVYITQLFSLYRLNWWPAALGAKTSYSIFWLLSISGGYFLHHFHFDSLSVSPVNTLSQAFITLTKLLSPTDDDDDDDDDDIQWQRKTLWVGLAFATMAMPALVCLVGLRRSGRQTYRHSLTDMQKAFLERQLARRIPASYIRFLWFIAAIGLSLVALIAGQGYASVYLSTLPHTGLDGTAYVTFWMTTVNLLAVISHWILEDKVRSRALLFANKYYYFLVYFIFYRNLFARLRSFDQFALVQLLSSFWVCIWYPLSMTSLFHRITQHFNPHPKSWEEYVESVGLAFYVRNLAQNTTMIAFLGWVSILHFGKNQHLYPFFAFDDQRDPYNYQLTMLGSGAIWASELITSFIARCICKWLFGVDVTNLGLDEFREFPELLPTCVWTSVHVLMDMLLFLIKLNFR